MILHFSHIGLTDGLTFMVPFELWILNDWLWRPLLGAATSVGSRARGEVALRRANRSR